MILITLDVDWAPDAVLEDSLALVESLGSQCTVMATHATSLLSGLDRQRFEVGIHPNFNTLIAGEGGGNPDAVVGDLMSLYPDAVSSRSHSLAESSRILDAVHNAGIRHDVTQFRPYHGGLEPFEYFNGLIRIPFNWEDDYHFTLGRSFEEPGVGLTDIGFAIMNFHPVHIFLNCESPERYVQARNALLDGRELDGFRNRDGTAGTRDLFIRMCELQASHSGPSSPGLISDLAAGWAAAKQRPT
jgi:hypothetical protein